MLGYFEGMIYDYDLFLMKFSQCMFFDLRNIIINNLMVRFDLKDSYDEWNQK